MIQRTVIHRARPAARIEAQASEKAFPLTFLAIAFGLLSGVVLAGVVVPAVIHTVVPAVIRAVTGA
jgi:hypothetical protein